MTQFGAALADIHATPCPLELKEQVGPWLNRMLDQAEINLKNGMSDGSESLLSNLQPHKPIFETEKLIHGDFTIDNVLIHEGNVTGIIDWGGGALGDARYDLALAIRPKPPIVTKADAEAFYRGYGKRKLTDEEFRYFVDLYEFF